MTYVPITPFRRRMTSGLIKHQQHATADQPPQGVNKWEVLRELTSARQSLGVSDRALGVLQALLSFHPETILGGNKPDLLVYPSNAAICDRLNGIACSTMRRHLACLVDAGLILRRDSPNGKRYVKRFAGEQQAFGFDLTPLVTRYAEICGLAEAARAQADAYQRLRRTVSLMRRDLAGLVIYGADAHPMPGLWEHLSALAARISVGLRRKVSEEDLRGFEAHLLSALDKARDVIDGVNTINMSTKDVHNEQHYQNSNKDCYVLEPSLEKERGLSVPEDEIETCRPNIPLSLVTSVCHEYETYTPDKVRHWHQLVHAADIVRPMMGISPTAWDDAVTAMGPEEAAVVVIAMLERFADIQSPGGYLRHLTRKAQDGAFSCGPMVMALMRKEAA